MHHWSTIDCSYLYDGTIEGLFTIVYQCFKEKKIPSQVMIEEEYLGDLFDQPVIIQTSSQQANHVVLEVTNKLSSAVLYHIYTAFLSGEKGKSKVIVEYIIHAFKYGNNINFMKSIDCVIEIQRICRNVKGEAHRMLGFLRFTELNNRFLYAKYESDNDILQLIAQHLKKRLKMEIWMIHDKKRQQIALYNGKKYVIVDAKTFDISSIEKNEVDKYLLLWKEYFRKITIQERENKRCQRQFMPKKYWKYLPEV